VSIRFLAFDEVMALHMWQVQRFGGERSLRDAGLLSSAIAMPEATFAGEHVHGFPYEMAAAYLFHITKNHPFVDGNKRAGLMTAVMFLLLNNIALGPVSDAELAELVERVAAGDATKAEVAVFFEKHCMSQSK
jgi:death on curing protein